MLMCSSSSFVMINIFCSCLFDRDHRGLDEADRAARIGWTHLMEQSGEAL